MSDDDDGSSLDLDLDHHIERLKDAAARAREQTSTHATAGGGWVSDRLQERRVQLGLGVGAAIVGALVVVVIAWLLYGLLSAIAAIVGLVIGVAAPWVWVRVARSPLGGPMFAIAFFILGQLTYGAGAIVRRDDGRYEWRRLQQDGDQLFAELSTGERVDIDGSLEELPTVGWAPVAIVEQKTTRNMDAITVDAQYAETRPDPAPGSDEPVSTPMADGSGGWHIDASKLEHWVRGTAEAAPVREGLRKALEEKGGAQQLSQLVTMLIAGGMLVGGFVLGLGAMML